MLQDSQDAFGHIYHDYMNGNVAAHIIERDDGLINIDLAAGYFREFDTWPATERMAMQEVIGRVLDIGCGAGKHCLYLQKQGHEVIGIDNSPLGIEVARTRGVRDVRLCDLMEISTDLGHVDTVVMMGNNLSLVGTPARAKRIFRKLYRITTEGGRIIGEIRNPYMTDDPVHLAYQEANRKKGKWGGQARLRVRYRKYATPWLGFLMVSKSELQGLVKGTGWHPTRYLEYPKGTGHGMYIAVLEKNSAIAGEGTTTQGYS